MVTINKVMKEDLATNRFLLWSLSVVTISRIVVTISRIVVVREASHRVSYYSPRCSLITISKIVVVHVGVCNHWTGLLDWTTGPDYWTLISKH